MPEHEIDDREKDVLLEVGAMFASRERNNLLEILSSGSGNYLRAQKVLYQRAIRSLEKKGLVQFSNDRKPLTGLFGPQVAPSPTKWYVTVTDEGRNVAEKIADQELSPADDGVPGLRLGE